MTEREKFIFNTFKDAHPMVLRMEENNSNTKYFVMYNEKEINFVLVIDGHIFPTLIKLKNFLSYYSDEDILAAILRDVL